MNGGWAADTGSMARHIRLLVALPLLLFAALSSGAATAGAATVERKVVRLDSARIAVFDLRGIDVARMQRATLVGPKRASRRVAVAEIRKGTRRGVLRLRLPWATRSTRLRFGLRARRVKGTPTPVVQPAPEPAPAPAPEPTSGVVKAMLQPLGTAVLSDATATARVRRSTWEPRPGNYAANHRVPTSAELVTYRALAPDWGRCNSYHQSVTGNFTGTTDEILQFAAHKWGLDEDVLRAVAAVESWWRQDAVGASGLMSVVATVHTGTAPLNQLSTAFNVDYLAAVIRQYYEGCAPWLNDVDRGATYAAGDLWGAVGTWYAGRWHTADAEWYITKVKQYLGDRIWETF